MSKDLSSNIAQMLDEITLKESREVFLAECVSQRLKDKVQLYNKQIDKFFKQLENQDFSEFTEIIKVLDTYSKLLGLLYDSFTNEMKKYKNL